MMKKILRYPLFDDYWGPHDWRTIHSPITPTITTQVDLYNLYNDDDDGGGPLVVVMMMTMMTITTQVDLYNLYGQ